jgi:hydrogenase maturation protein HypF
MTTVHIHIKGRVQGVGFRPFIHHLAQKYDLTGWVANGSDGVHIELNGALHTIDAFVDTVKANPPHQSIITQLIVKRIDDKCFEGFQIVESAKGKTAELLISPDFALCEKCRKEFHDPENRRYQYPFITCTQCGPRYSIMKALPYDRCQTSMASFVCCDDCKAEYREIKNRRYYSQTNSCQECAIQLKWMDMKTGECIRDTKTIIRNAVASLRMGKILAVKGIGGYLLMAPADDSQAVQRLRNRKSRPSKPFAVMYPTIQQMEEDVEISVKEREKLLSTVSPILLLRKKMNRSKIALEALAPGLNRLGVMLPYTPLFEGILSALNVPVVATSANLTDEPIIYRDSDAIKYLADIADYLLINNREIVTPQDDSVMKITDTGYPILIRRSRGYAPAIYNKSLSDAKVSMVAMGADVKAAFGFLSKGNAVLSQYLGNLEKWGAQESYVHCLRHIRDMLGIKPDILLADDHPAYHSRHLGKATARAWEIPMVTVQHHEAHFAAVLSENKLLNSNETTLGIIWDGTGWGRDGNIWGSEFIRYQKGDMQSITRLSYYPNVLGDKMSREPRLAALAMAGNSAYLLETVREYFTREEWQYYRKCLSKAPALHNSSMGRLFDAVASLLGILQFNDYEGHAAMRLECTADQYLRNHSFPLMEWPWESDDLHPVHLLEWIAQQQQNGASHGEIAAAFHSLLVSWIEKVAISEGIRKLAFSGGVFQNAVLVDALVRRLSERFELYFHQELSPNDECIAWGQMAWYHAKMKAEKSMQIAEKEMITV